MSPSPPAVSRQQGRAAAVTHLQSWVSRWCWWSHRQLRATRTGGWAQEGPMWALLSPHSFWGSDPSLRPPQSAEGCPAPYLPVAAPCPPTPRLSKFLPVLLLPPEPFSGHRTTPTVPISPRHPRTSAAEAKGEQGQEGQQDEGLHGAFLCWAEHSLSSLGVFIGCCGLGKGGGMAPPGLFPAHPPWPELPAEVAIVVWDELGPPMPSQSPQREGNVALGRRGFVGGPSPAGLAAPSPHWNG